MKAQWPREAPKGGAAFPQAQSISSGRGPPMPQVVQAIQDHSQSLLASAKGKGDSQGKGDFGRGKGNGKGSGPSGGNSGGSAKGDGKGVGIGMGKVMLLDCSVCKAMHRESMAKGKGPIPFDHNHRESKYSAAVWDGKLSIQTKLLEDIWKQGGSKGGGQR